MDASVAPLDPPGSQSTPTLSRLIQRQGRTSRPAHLRLANVEASSRLPQSGLARIDQESTQ